MQDNLTPKTLRQFENGDTLYYKKTVNGFSSLHFCRFVELRNGVVVADVVRSSLPAAPASLTRIGGKAQSFYLLGKKEGEERPRFHHFKTLDTPAQ